MMPTWFVTSIALLRSPGALTKEDVLTECECVGLDPAPVMILTLGLGPMSWPVVREHADGRRTVYDKRFEGYWQPVGDKRGVFCDTPEVREAIELYAGALGRKVVARASFPEYMDPAGIFRRARKGTRVRVDVATS